MTRSRSAGFRVALVVFGLLGILGVTVMRDPVLHTRLEASIETRDTAKREDIWQDSLALFMESPLFGFGNRTSTIELGQFRSEGIRATNGRSGSGRARFCWRRAYLDRWHFYAFICNPRAQSGVIGNLALARLCFPGS